MVIDFDTELNLAFSGAACPSARLCVVTDGSGDVLTSTRPASGRRQWRVGRVSGADRSLTCPSTKLCVSLGPGALAFSTHPAGGARTWHTTDLQTPLSGVAQVSCATLHLCVAVDWGDDVLESTRPTRGSAAWTEANLGQGSNSLTSISCPASGLCVAADDAGNVITSTDPAAGDWSRTDLAPVLGDTGRQPILSAVSCPSASFCATVSSAGVVLTSDDPTGSAAAWSAEPASTGGLEALDCPSSELCVATDGYGNLLTTTTPSSGPWTSVQLGGPPVCDKYGCSYDALGRVSCEGDQFCAATDGASLWVSTDPTGGAGAWTKSTLPAPAVASTLACPAAGTCVLADGSEVMSTADATVPDPEWTMTSLPAESVSFPIGPPASASVSAISCVSTTMCVAVDHIDGYAFSGNPAGGTWTADRLDPPTNSPLLGDATLSDVSCSPDDQCVAIDETGHAYVGQLASP
jgi:hypothetical protein